MIQIGNTLVSLDIIECFFKCDIEVCKGQCCIDGDSGAPLKREEKDLLDKHKVEIMKYLTPAGKLVLASEGTSYIDEEGDLVTSLIGGANCTFTTYDSDGKCLCALECAYRKGELPQLKPESCHLYPIRLKEIGELTGLNYHRWKICKSAETAGRRDNIRVYEFLKEPLIRKFGKEWYQELELVAAEWLKNNGNNV